MKILLLFNSQWAIPSIDALIQSQALVGIGLPQKNKSTYQKLLYLTPQAKNLLFRFKKENWVSAVEERLHSLKPDGVFVITFPYQIPKDLLILPTYGFFNFHFGALPKYAGDHPIFWQIKNREQQATVTVHRMDEHIDTGPILLKKSFPIFPQDTYDLVNIRMSYLAVEAVNEIVEKIKNDKEHLKSIPQITGERIYLKKAERKDVTINWEMMSAEEIIALTNATNSWNMGAFTYIRSFPVRILEVSKVSNPSTVASKQQIPGSIIALDDQRGLLVKCINDEILRIEILHTDIGFISGKRLSSLGITCSDRFENNETES